MLKVAETAIEGVEKLENLEPDLTEENISSTLDSTTQEI